MKPIKRSAPCPCQSGRIYGECCQPFHRGGEPPTAEALMRSRFAAFALGEVDYLVRTLHPEHADLGRDRGALIAALRAACREQRYMGLSVVEFTEDSVDEAHVTFAARVFHRGKDISFQERSLFRRTEDGWRYLSGELGTL